MIMMGDRKKAVTAILGPKSDGVGVRGEEDEGPDALHAISEELIDSFHAKDAAGVASGLRAAFEAMDSEPTAEG